MMDSDTAQVKYYLWLLEEHGVDSPTGLLEYPKLRQTQPVALTDEDRARIPQELAAMRALLAGDTACPPVINKPFCKQCAYYEFCYVAE